MMTIVCCVLGVLVIVLVALLVCALMVIGAVANGLLGMYHR